MAGMSTNDKIAVITTKLGLGVETFADWEDVLRSVAYRVCAENGYTLDKLNSIVGETRDQIAIDTAPSGEISEG